jgi:hypothetical protein
MPDKPLVELHRKVERAEVKLLMAALGFVDMTLGEMDALEGTESASAPAEFMVLHEAASEYRLAVRAVANLEDGLARHRKSASTRL